MKKYDKLVFGFRKVSFYHILGKHLKPHFFDLFLFKKSYMCIGIECIQLLFYYSPRVPNSVSVGRKLALLFADDTCSSDDDSILEKPDSSLNRPADCTIPEAPPQFQVRNRQPILYKGRHSKKFVFLLVGSLNTFFIKDKKWTKNINHSGLDDSPIPFIRFRSSVMSPSVQLSFLF